MASWARLPLARLLAAGLTAIGAFALQPLTAAAAASVTITGHLGYADTVKVGAWAPLDVTLATQGPEVAGTLVVRGLFGVKPAVPWLATYQRPITVFPGVAQHAQFHLSIEQAGMVAEVQLVSDGRVVARAVIGATHTATTLVGVLSDNTTALDELGAIHPAGLTATVVHLGLADLPSSAVPLRAFDLLAFDDVSTSGLSAAQVTALADYVRGGGAILVGTGSSWNRTLAGLPADILPMRPDGSTLLASSSAVGAAHPLAVATGPASGGTAWLSEGSLPLLLEAPVGQGVSELATYDLAPAGDPGWTAEPTILRQVLVRTVFGGGGSASAIPLKGALIPGGPFGGAGTSIYERSGAVSSTLGGVPALDLPSFVVTGLIVLAYVILVGPVNFLVLRALKRRALAWITLPVIAAVVSAAAYGGAVLTKGQSLEANQVAILHLQAGGSRGYLEAYTGVLSPTRGDNTVLPAASVMVSPISDYFGGGTVARGDLVVDLGDGLILLPGMTAFSVRGFGTEETYAAGPKLAVHLAVANGKLVGSVENDSDLTFGDAVLIAGDGYQKLGALAPGATVNLQVEPKPVTVNGPGVLTGVYPGYNGGPGNTAPTEAQVVGQQKAQLLALLTSAGFNGAPSTSAAPILVAWLDQSLEPVTVNGAHPRGRALTAVAVTIPVDLLGPGPVPASAVGGRIVDADGTSSGGPPGMLALSDGSVTFDFAPPLPAGAHLHATSIADDNPYLTAVGPGGSSGVLGEAWDWSTSSWVDVSFKQAALTPLPDSVVNPATGEVRFRVSVSNGFYIAGGLSLTGTVQ